MTATPPPLLSLRQITRRFGGLTAVDSVSAEIDRGELVGLIGPNGAGKTTLFNLISGVVRHRPVARGGLRGRTLAGLRPFEVARLGVARTFQNLRIFPNMTVFDNVWWVPSASCG